METKLEKTRPWSDDELIEGKFAYSIYQEKIIEVWDYGQRSAVVIAYDGNELWLSNGRRVKKPRRVRC